MTDVIGIDKPAVALKPADIPNIDGVIRKPGAASDWTITFAVVGVKEK